MAASQDAALFRRPPRSVPHPQNAHLIPRDAVANDIRVSRDQFAHIGFGNPPATVGETSEGVTGLDQSGRHLRRGMRVKLGQVTEYPGNLAQRYGRPNDTHG